MLWGDSGEDRRDFEEEGRMVEAETANARQAEYGFLGPGYYKFTDDETWWCNTLADFCRNFLNEMNRLAVRK